MKPTRKQKIDAIALFVDMNDLGLGDLDAWSCEMTYAGDETGVWLDNHDFTGPEHAVWIERAKRLEESGMTVKDFLAGLRIAKGVD